MATKKELQEVQDKLTAANQQISELNKRIDSLKQDVLAEISETLPSMEAKKTLTTLAPLTRNKEEMILLIRALSRIE